MESFTWITICYHLPMTPSGSRVYAWRKLKELGAAYLRQGVAVLPHSNINVHRAQALAAKIRGMDGQCTIAEMRFLDEKDHLQMVETFKAQSKDEFKQLLLDAVRLSDKLSVGNDEKAMRKRYIKAKNRDYFNIENEIRSTGFWGEFFADLNTDGGWAELLSDLHRSYKDVGRMMAGFMPEPHMQSKAEENEDDNITV